MLTNREIITTKGAANCNVRFITITVAAANLPYIHKLVSLIAVANIVAKENIKVVGRRRSLGESNPIFLDTI